MPDLPGPVTQPEFDVLSKIITEQKSLTSVLVHINPGAGRTFCGLQTSMRSGSISHAVQVWSDTEERLQFMYNSLQYRHSYCTMRMWNMEPSHLAQKFAHKTVSIVFMENQAYGLRVWWKRLVINGVLCGRVADSIEEAKRFSRNHSELIYQHNGIWWFIKERDRDAASNSSGRTEKNA